MRRRGRPLARDPRRPERLSLIHENGTATRFAIDQTREDVAAVLAEAVDCSVHGSVHTHDPANVLLWSLAVDLLGTEHAGPIETRKMWGPAP